MKNFSLHNLLTAWALAQKRVFLRKLSCACAHAPPSSLSPHLFSPSPKKVFFSSLIFLCYLKWLYAGLCMCLCVSRSDWERCMCVPRMLPVSVE